MAGDGMKDIIIALDRSLGKRKIYSLVIMNETNLPQFNQKASWLKHISELPKRERMSYLRKFPERYQNLKPLLHKVELTPFFSDIAPTIENSIPSVGLVIVDDAVLNKQLKAYANQKNVLRESIAKNRKKFRLLVLLADNLAYYGREVFENTKTLTAFKRELRRRGIL